MSWVAGASEEEPVDYYKRMHLVLGSRSERGGARRAPTKRVSIIAFCFVFFSQEVDRLCSELGMRLYRTSVKEDMGVSSVFQHLAEDYVSKIKSFNDELIHVSTIQI